MHYDFRLETENGVLRSWAIPKGISLNPQVKRLAILTEDHPLDYIRFEGVIPEKNYGAGTVTVWDTGTYTTSHSLEQQFKEGKISFELHGTKVKGSFSLLKMKDQKSGDKQWLLIKANDEFASSEDPTQTRPESVLTGRTNRQLEPAKGLLPEGNTRLKEFPSSVRPMLAMSVDKPFDSKDWVFEVKWDGIRCIYFRNKAKGVHELRSRRGTSITRRYPEIMDMADSAIKCNDSVILDGEIVVLGDNGQPDFQKHQQRMNVDSSRDIANLARDSPATYFVFDILYRDGNNLEEKSFIERRRILSDVIGKTKRIRISDYIEDKGTALFEQTRRMGLEGIMAKYKYSSYQQGKRSDDWLKIKGILTQDCVVIGYTRGEGNREGYFGSLILAAYHGDRLRFMGHSGSGFGFSQLQELYQKLQELRTEKCPIAHVPYVNRTPFWVKPEMVVEVKFNGWTRDKIMRAPIFVRLRDDKSPKECIVESPKDTKKVIPPKTVKPESSNLTNLDKVFWPATAEHLELKKRDLIGYYEKISKYIAPHLQDRPLSLSRYPDGISGKSFFQKDWNQAAPDFVKTVQVFSEARNDIINHIICNNHETLLWLANLGCIEMHPWYSRVRDYNACLAEAESNKLRSNVSDRCGLGTPDFIVFDLDPYISGEEQKQEYKGFKAAVDVAYNLKDLLDRLGIKSYVKTSGKTGLHVFVPVTPDYSYDQTRAFAEVIGKIMIKRKPDDITIKWNTAQRKGKVFFDYNQNAKGKTLASVFSLRPTALATVSMPVEWKDLADVLPTDFTLITVPNIIKKSGDPWKNILQDKQDVAKLLEKVSSL